MLLLYNLEVSRTNCGFPNLDNTSPVNRLSASLVKWKAPKLIKSSHAVFVRNLGFISIEEMPLPAMLKAVIMFYRWVSRLSRSA